MLCSLRRIQQDWTHVDGFRHKAILSIWFYDFFVREYFYWRNLLMTTATQKQSPLVANLQGSVRKAQSIRHQPRAKRYYFDVGLGCLCLSGTDTGGAYCLVEVSLAPGMGVPRHTHTREDEVYFVLAGELEVTVGEKTFVLQPGDSLLAPRDIPHKLRNSGNAENRYLLLFSPSGFEEFVMATAVPAPQDAVAPTEPPVVAVQNVHKLATDFGIVFGQ